MDLRLETGYSPFAHIDGHHVQDAELSTTQVKAVGARRASSQNSYWGNRHHSSVQLLRHIRLVGDEKQNRGKIVVFRGGRRAGVC